MKIDFSKPITAPVLLLVFNRPDKTRRVFNAIRSVKPAKLYVAADHPRNGRDDDEKNCSEVKSIVTNVDWPCETHYLFHPENRGCSLAGKLAWDWFFDQEDEMIFLEDDGLVSPSFFYFCQQMLNRYRNNSKIGYVAGVNHGLQKQDGASYFFTRISPSTYGMATWKRTYQLYEYGLDSYATCRNSPEFMKNFESKYAYYVYRSFFDRYMKYGGNTYDLQMGYLVHKYGLLTVVPNMNLVTNIGFDGQGSNSTSVNDVLARRLKERARIDITEIVDPNDVSVDPAFEHEYFNLRVLYGKNRVSYAVDEFVLRPARRLGARVYHSVKRFLFR